MPRLIWLLLTLVLVVLGFAAGRLMAPPATFSPTPPGEVDMLGTAWDDFIRAQQETLALFQGSPFFEDDQERAEAYRGLLYAIIGSIKAGALQDPDQPRISLAPLKSKLRHYLNLRKMPAKLSKILEAFSWGRIDDALGLERSG